MTDPIADFLTRIRNAYLVGKKQVTIPHSKTKQSLAKIINDAGFIDSVSIKDTKPQKTINLTLRYINKIPAISGIKRVSKPGLRQYVRSDKIKPILSGQGITIITTSQGLMTGTTARKKSIGGEIICQIW